MLGMRVAGLLLAACLLSCAACTGRRGEIVLSGYAGRAFTDDGNLTLRTPPATRVAFRDVGWDDESFEPPPYYGLRATYWSRARPCWGVALDFTHTKVYADTSEVTRRSGTVDGRPVTERGPISDHLESFSMSHGLNVLTANVMRRWFPWGRDRRHALGRLSPYVGAGLGVTIPHVEAVVNGVSTDEFQLGGPAAQLLAGVDVGLVGPVSTFLEYKALWTDVDADLAGGGTLSTTQLTHQLVVGLSVRF